MKRRIKRIPDEWRRSDEWRKQKRSDVHTSPLPQGQLSIQATGELELGPKGNLVRSAQILWKK